jgi:hypothetical protein
MTTFERGMLRYLQGKTADAIARGEDLPWNGLYAPSGIYGPATNQSVANPPTKTGTKKDKHSSSHHKNAKYWDFV